MRKTALTNVVILAATLVLTPFPATAQPANTYSAADITDLILVTGQSNVRGSLTEYDPTLDAAHPRVLAFTTSREQNAYSSGGVWQQADLHQAWDIDGWHPGNDYESLTHWNEKVEQAKKEKYEANSPV